MSKILPDTSPATTSRPYSASSPAVFEAIFKHEMKIKYIGILKIDAKNYKDIRESQFIGLIDYQKYIGKLILSIKKLKTHNSSLFIIFRSKHKKYLITLFLQFFQIFKHLCLTVETLQILIAILLRSLSAADQICSDTSPFTSVSL